MKRHISAALLGASVFAAAACAHANNRGVEAALASYGDLSVFYQAMLNTGVLNELNENTHYTIFAPTDEAFAAIRPSVYPCFYAVQCRAQVADVLRDHIVAGRESLRDLAQEAEIPTIGRYRIYAETPYVGEYDIAHHRVLSSADINGNMIYRINGVIMSNQQQAQFQAMPPVANANEETVTTYYRTPVAYPVPGGGYPAATTETVTQKTYAVPDATTTTYSDGPQTTIITRQP